MSTPPRGLIEHETRLDILCCLEDEALTATGIAARIGKSPEAVTYFLLPLHSYGVVRTTGDREGGEQLYEALLDDQPAWVREAVDEHRRRSED